MRKLSPREIGLLVIFGLGAIAVFYYYSGGDLGFSSSGGEPVELGEIGEPPVVRMDLLARGAEGYDPSGRNLFDYYVPPPPPRAAPIRKPATGPPKTNRAATQAPVRKASKPTGPSPPTPKFKFVGYLGPKENLIGVFELNQETIVRQAGEVIEEQFKLLEFGYETVVLGYVDERFADRTTELKMRAN